MNGMLSSGFGCKEGLRGRDRIRTFRTSSALALVNSRHGYDGDLRESIRGVRGYRCPTLILGPLGGLRDTVCVAVKHLDVGMGRSREEIAEAVRNGLPSVFHLHFKEHGGRAAERVTIVHRGGSARCLRKGLIVAESVEVAHIESYESDFTIVPLQGSGLVVIPELLLGAERYFVPVDINVRDADTFGWNVVQRLDLGGERGPRGLVRKVYATDESIRRFGELELDGRHVDGMKRTELVLCQCIYSIMERGVLDISNSAAQCTIENSAVGADCAMYLPSGPSWHIPLPRLKFQTRAVHSSHIIRTRFHIDSTEIWYTM